MQETPLRHDRRAATSVVDYRAHDYDSQVEHMREIQTLTNDIASSYHRRDLLLSAWRAAQP